MTDGWDEPTEEVFRYTRKYPTMVETTFHPFKIGPDWYALYSDNYRTLKRVNLQTGEILASNDNHFCPADTYVPAYQNCTYDMKEKTFTYQVFDQDFAKDVQDDLKKGAKYKYFKEEWLYRDWAYVAGCYWGDDSTMKVRILDVKTMEYKDDQIEYGDIELYNSDRMRDTFYLDEEQDIIHTVKYFRHGMEVATPHILKSDYS